MSLEAFLLILLAAYIVLLVGTVAGLRLAHPTASHGWNLMGSSLFIVSATLLAVLVAYSVYFFFAYSVSEG